mgnify:CR=1 FL=1
MKAMLFAAGKGTRLKPLTDRHPKCLVTAGKETLLEHGIQNLKRAGVTTIVINIHHFAEQIIDFVTSRDFGLEIKLSAEKELLETGGGLLFAAEHFRDEDSFLVCNSDIYSTLDLRTLLDYHHKSNQLATLAVSQRETSRYLRFNEEQLLVGWENRKTNEVVSWNRDPFENRAFNGIQVMSPKIFDYMADLGERFSTILVYLNAAQAGESIGAYPMDDSFWIDIGTVAKLESLRTYLKTYQGEDSNHRLD